jgi:hypothetical protein
MPNNFEVTIPADAFVMPSSAYPSSSYIQERPYLAYDDSTQETAITQPFQMPGTYTGSGTLKLDIHYMMATATSGKVEFEVSVEAVTPADALDLDSASSFDSVNNGVTDPVAGTAGYLMKLTVTLTNKDSVAAADYVRIKVSRDADDGTNDTATGDARLLCVVLREET